VTVERRGHDDPDWRLFFEQAPVPMCVFDRETLIIRAANDAFVAQYGWSREELMRMRMSDVRPPEQRAHFEQSLRKFAAGDARDVAFEAPWKHHRKDGSRIDIRGYATRTTFAGQAAILAVLIDETPRRAVEARWREADGMWRSLVDTSPDVVTIFDLEGTVLFVNRIRAPFADRQIVGSKVWAFAGDGGTDRIAALIERVVRTREAVVYEAQGPSAYGVAWYEARAIPLVMDESVQRVMLIATDITERKLAADKVQASERRFRAIVEHGSDCIVLFGADHRITYASPALLRALGYEAQELIGTVARGFIHPDDHHAAQAAGLGSDEGQAIAGTLRIRHKDGSWRWLEGTSTNLLSDPGVRAIVSNRRDVTDRMRLEEQLRQSQKLEAIGLLAGGVAHDFNNLLAIIVGYTEVAEQELAKGRPVSEMLKEVTAAARRGADLTRQLLAFSRKQFIQPRPVDLGSTVTAFARMVRRIVGEDIEFEVVLGSELVVVNADPVQLEQVLLNLCTNARQAMADGGRLRLSISAETFDAAFVASHPWALAGEFAVITVSDTGVGMDEATRARAFEPFFTTKAEGTGLGLATVYGIVEQHGGFTHLRSSSGEGTTVRVHIPRVGDDALAVTPSVQGAVADTRGTETLLLAEDEPSLRALAATTLSALGYRVIVTADGEEAVREYELHAADIALVVLDVIMPRMGARVAYERIRRLRPDAKVLFTTGYAPEATRLGELIDGGRTRLLEKPFTPGELAACVRSAIDA
jgi:PAS domain S-box-containing protein